MTITESTAHWAMAYHSNSSNPRARKWYYVARIVMADGKYYCIGQHSVNTSNYVEARKRAKADGLHLVPILFRDAPFPHQGPEMQPCPTR